MDSGTPSSGLQTAEQDSTSAPLIPLSTSTTPPTTSATSLLDPAASRQGSATHPHLTRPSLSSVLAAMTPPPHSLAGLNPGSSSRPVTSSISAPTTDATVAPSFTMDMAFMGEQQPHQPGSPPPTVTMAIPRHRPSTVHTSHPDPNPASLMPTMPHSHTAPHLPTGVHHHRHPHVHHSHGRRTPAPGTDGGAGSAGDSEDGTPVGEMESVSSAFRHFLGQNPELRGVVSGVEKYIPFFVLLLMKGLFDHSTGLVVSVCLVLTFFHANSVVKQQVARQSRRNPWPLLAVLVNLAACIGFIYFVFREERLYHCAIFIPPSSVDSLYDLLWMVGVNDFVLKFAAVIVKICLIFVPASMLPYQKKGKYFLFVERVNQLHRELSPMEPWLVYLMHHGMANTAQTVSKILSVLLVAVYMVFKGRLLLKAARALKASVEKLMQVTSYGKSPNEDQLKASGGNCPICYDVFRVPTLLHCRHIFCEDCLATWFDRERTCPMCRAQVTEDPQWRDGATSQFLQLF